MNKNVGKTDRMVRIILGLAFLSLFFILDGNARFLGLVGIVPILTALVNFCPLYTLLGINTGPSK